MSTRGSFHEEGNCTGLPLCLPNIEIILFKEKKVIKKLFEIINIKINLYIYFFHLEALAFQRLGKYPGETRSGLESRS